MQEGAAEEASVMDWCRAIQLLQDYDRGREHLDTLLERREPRSARWLVMSVFRNRLLLDRHLEHFWKRRPRGGTLNLFRMALAEVMERGAADLPQIVHHAVKVSRSLGMSKAEQGFANALLRRALGQWDTACQRIEATHPSWLVKRWREQFGDAALRRLLEWNQQQARLLVSADCAMAGMEPSSWPGYYWLGTARISDLAHELLAGAVYVQDAFARIPVQLLQAQPGECIMDLCAAPGGKTRLIGRSMQGLGKLYAVDLAGVRFERLQANVAGWGFPNLRVIGSRLEELEARMEKESVAPGEADAVHIDVPCSNTGVIQKRPDVKFRLTPEAIEKVAAQQQQLLELAARWVRPGGRLVYSTCSIEDEENTAVVKQFCDTHPQWQLQKQVMSYPWECEHDGGGAFLLTRAEDS